MDTKQTKPRRLLSLLLALIMTVGVLCAAPASMTAVAAEITAGNATVTAPIGGQTPSFTAVSDDPSSYSVEVLRWIDMDTNQDIYQSNLSNPTSEYYNFKFKGGHQYEVVVEFTAVGDNTLSYDNTFTINGKTTYWTGNGLKRYYMFIAKSSMTIPTIANKEVPVGTEVFIPWPEGATSYQRFEGSTLVGSGDKSGYPTGMHIPAQSTATTKTYTFNVHFSDGWLDSNEFTVTWKYSAHSVTVTGGTASSSSAMPDTEITLTPSAAPSGLVFDKWNVVSGGVTVTDNKFTMPNADVEIKATYKVSIANQEVEVGTDVYIPWPEGATSYQRFEGSTLVWSGDKSGYPTGMYIPAQSTATTKTYTFNVHFSDGWLDSNEFTVTWKDAAPAEYDITVTDGKATDSAKNAITKAAVGTTVTLTANAAPTGKEFDKWVVVSGDVTLADANSATTTFTMPKGNVSVKATYKDHTTHSYTANIKQPEALKTAGTCKDKAIYLRSCKVCGKVAPSEAWGSFFGDLDPNNHAGGTSTVNASEPDHKNQINGYTGDTKCLGCNEIIGYGTSIPAGAHTPSSTWNSNETYHWKECTAMGCDVVIYGSKAEHTPDREAATETDPIKCSVCDYIITPALGHTHHMTPVTENPATCTEDGNKAYYTCDGCDKWFEDAAGSVEITDKTGVVIAAKGHTYVKVAEVPATTDSTGIKEHYECSVCGKLFDMDKNEVTASELVIPKLEPTVKYGDLNGDGKINLLDLVSMRKYLAKWSITVDKAAADCNADGKINLMDLILLRKYLAKWSVTLGPQK